MPHDNDRIDRAEIGAPVDQDAPREFDLDEELRGRLDAIREESTPEHLLDLARNLQKLLREREGDDRGAA